MRYPERRQPTNAPLAATRDSRVPLHVQIREIIRHQIGEGALVDESGRLMTEDELVRHFGVSRITIRNAIQPLVAEGLLSRQRGRGTFVRSNQPENWVGRLMGLSETIRDAGQEPGARILQKGMTNQHDDTVRERLRQRAVWQLWRVRFADRTPIAIEHAFYPPEIGLDLESRDLTSIVMYRVFESEFGLDLKEATQTISATLADDATAEILNVEPRSPLLFMERLTVSADGTPVEFLRSVYVPEHFRFTINLTRRRT